MGAHFEALDEGVLAAALKSTGYFPLKKRGLISKHWNREGVLVAVLKAFAKAKFGDALHRQINSQNIHIPH